MNVVGRGVKELRTQWLTNSQNVFFQGSFEFPTSLEDLVNRYLSDTEVLNECVSWSNTSNMFARVGIEISEEAFMLRWCQDWEDVQNSLEVSDHEYDRVDSEADLLHQILLATLIPEKVELERFM